MKPTTLVIIVYTFWLATYAFRNDCGGAAVSVILLSLLGLLADYCIELREHRE